MHVPITVRAGGHDTPGGRMFVFTLYGPHGCFTGMMQPDEGDQMVQVFKEGIQQARSKLIVPTGIARTNGTLP
jgi:hypothetical protein